MGKPEPNLNPEALDAFCRYVWPGNVRQLRNVVETAVALNRDGNIGLSDLPLELSPITEVIAHAIKVFCGVWKKPQFVKQ